MKRLIIAAALLAMHAAPAVADSPYQKLLDRPHSKGFLPMGVVEACKQGDAAACELYRAGAEPDDFTDMLNAVKCLDGDAVACELDSAARVRDEAAEQERERQRAVAAGPGREPGTIRVGDTQDYVASQWGEPERTDRMVSGYGAFEWWWYGSQAVHFANGLVDSIHTGN
jgi:hypothetical protein